ncbi:hypothetical protein SK128_014323, partial [Halocaridina rubra]
MNFLKLQGSGESSRTVELDGEYAGETYDSGSSYDGSGSSGSSSSSSSSSSETYYSGSSGSGSSSSSSSSSSSTSYSSSSRTTYTSSSSSSNSRKGSSYSSEENELVRRTRQASGPLDWDEEVESCGPTECTKIHCSVGLLTESDVVYIYVRSRLMVDTLEN